MPNNNPTGINQYTKGRKGRGARKLVGKKPQPGNTRAEVIARSYSKPSSRTGDTHTISLRSLKWTLQTAQNKKGDIRRGQIGSILSTPKKS